jgi:hypothetical protein
MSEDEEFEFRARAEAEQALAQKQQAAQQPTPGAMPGQGPVEPGMLESAGNFMTQTAIPTAFGVGKAGMDLAAANPAIASVAAAAAFPKVASKIPGVGQVMDIGKGLVDVAKNYNLNQMEHQAVQYMKAGQQPPAEFAQRLQALRQAGMPKGPITPPGVTATPQAGPSVMQRGMDMASKMREFAAQRVMPAAGQAGQALGQAAQQAGSMIGKGLSAAAPALRVGGTVANALYSGDLNANEQAELERRRKMQPTITR